MIKTRGWVWNYNTATNKKASILYADDNRMEYSAKETDQSHDHSGLMA